MKKPILLLTASVFFYFMLTSYSQGLTGIIAPQNRTGAGGSLGNCSGTSCHPANNSGLSLSIALWDIVANAQVTNGKYIPNKPYQIRIEGKYGQGGDYPTFGYQLTTESEGNDYGAFFSNPGLRASVIAPYEIIEHMQPIVSEAPTTFRDTINWLAPDPGNEDVTIYLTLLAANSDMSINGDLTNNTNRIFQEGTTSVADLGDKVKTTLYPNPVREHFSLKMTGAAKGTYSLLAYNQKGAVLEQRTVTVKGEDMNVTFNTSTWASGSYYLMVCNDDARRVIPFVKQ